MMAPMNLCTVWMNAIVCLDVHVFQAFMPSAFINTEYSVTQSEPRGKVHTSPGQCQKPATNDDTFINMSCIVYRAHHLPQWYESPRGCIVGHLKKKVISIFFYLPAEMNTQYARIITVTKIISARLTNFESFILIDLSMTQDKHAKSQLQLMFVQRLSRHNNEWITHFISN